MEIEIRQIKPEDVEETQILLYETWLDTYLSEEFDITKDDIEELSSQWRSAEATERHKRWLLNIPDNWRSFVAWDGEKAVGVCVLVKHEDKNQIRSIYVLPEYQRCGVGRKFWAEALRFFDPIKDTIVHVAVYNEKAISFYKKLGFADTGKRFSEERFRTKRGAAIPEMEMVLLSEK